MFHRAPQFVDSDFPETLIVSVLRRMSRIGLMQLLGPYWHGANSGAGNSGGVPCLTWESRGGHAGILQLTLASQIAKIIYANRQPKGDSGSDRPAQRMGSVTKRLVQDREERGLEKLCRGSEQLEELRCGGVLRGFRYKP
jgi:hypothetical protein